MYYLWVLEHTPQFSCHLCNLVGTGASSNFNLNCNLACFGVYMVKLCHEKMLILRCILPPPQKK